MSSKPLPVSFRVQRGEPKDHGISARNGGSRWYTLTMYDRFASNRQE